MVQFYPLKVKDIYKETKDCSVVTFEVPEEVQSSFQFKPGQHLTLKAMIDGEELRRSYSLCSAPFENEWRVAVKKIDGGKFSGFVNDRLKKGATLEVMVPSGSFHTDIDPSKAKNYIAFAAGSGITPVLSMIKTHLKEEPNSTFKLFYLNRKVKSIIFKEEIEQLKNVYFNRFEIFHFLTQEHRHSELFNGRFTAEKLQFMARALFNPEEVDACFICGPEDMIHLIKDELSSLGVAKENIHFELFTTGLTEADKKRIASLVEKKVEGTEVTIIDGGKEFHFVMGEDYDNLLDGALAAGADLPFACKGGVCSTCRCQVVEGTAEMKLNYSLEEEDLAKNYVLSCQAVPTSKKLVIDFGI